MKKYAGIIFAVIFVAVIYVLTREPLAALGAAIAVSFGVLLYRQKMNESWKGVITEFKEESYTQKEYDDEGRVYSDL